MSKYSDIDFFVQITDEDIDNFVASGLDKTETIINTMKQRLEQLQSEYNESKTSRDQLIQSLDRQFLSSIEKHNKELAEENAQLRIKYEQLANEVNEDEKPRKTALVIDTNFDELDQITPLQQQLSTITEGCKKHENQLESLLSKLNKSRQRNIELRSSLAEVSNQTLTQMSKNISMEQPIRSINYDINHHDGNSVVLKPKQSYGQSSGRNLPSRSLYDELHTLDKDM